jgi:hypothetical protein
LYQSNPKDAADICVVGDLNILTTTHQTPFDYQHGGFPHLLYWLEVESMALQLAGGKLGEAAVSAARTICESVPHSVILARYVCCSCWHLSQSFELL